MDIIFEILSRLINQKNGAVTESMTANGIIYKVNYGVALHTIKKIAQEYAPDHELALQLYERAEREAKLAAVYIEDPQAVTTGQLERWSKDFINLELAEVAGGQLFYKTPYALTYSYGWCSSPNTYLQKAGWTIIARLAPLNNTATEQLLPYFELAENADLSHPAIRQAIISALVKIGMKNADLHKSVTEFANRLKNENADKQCFAKETMAFLNL